MRNRNIIYILSVMVLVLLSASSCGKKRIDWRQRYYTNETVPYGTYIAYNLLKDVYPNSKITRSRTSIITHAEEQVYNSNDKVFNEDTGEYDHEQINLNKRRLDSYYAETYNNETKISYLFVASTFAPHSLEMQCLFDLVGTGNDVFISSAHMSADFCGRLQIQIAGKSVSGTSGLEYSLVDYPRKKYVNKERPTQNYYFEYATSHPLRIEVLGYGNDKKANFIRIQYGKGYFYLHTQPSVFANIEMLDTEKYDYGFRCLSYMDDGSRIIWDESLTKGAYDTRKTDNSGSMFRVIYSSPALTWAFHIILIGLLLFMVFRSKRMQRIIPDIVRPKNTTIEFLDTISNMYYKKRDYVSYVEKRHMFFLDFIRRNFYMATEQVDEEFCKDLHSKSGASISVIKAIFSYYTTIMNGGSASEDVFMGYNAQLEKFYDTIKNNKTK